MDLQRRRHERRSAAGFWHQFKHNPYFSIAAGLHLLVWSRDGALSYALPGRRSGNFEGQIT